MKNFTKQNFKTNPLWIRLLIMTFMLLIGTSGAWAKYNQPAVDLYFDNSEAQWDNCRVYIGHDKWLAFYNMSRVSGTEHLWKLSSDFNSGNSWNDATHWGFTSDYWEAKEQSVIKIVYTGDKKFTYDNTNTVDENAWKNDKIYKTNGTANVTLDNQTKKAYKITSLTKSNYTVTINSETGGTLTVNDYDNNTVSNGASKIYLTVLKFSASASDGYTLEEVQIYDGSTTTTISAADLASTTYTLKSAVTITPAWKKTCTPPDAPELTNPDAQCGRSITLPATYNEFTLKWYDENGSVVNNTTITSSGTYYAAAVGECESIERTRYIITINPVPSAPSFTTGGETTCAEKPVNPALSNALGDGKYLVWYDASEGGTNLGSNLTSSAEDGTTIYYAAVSNGACESADRTQYKVDVEADPIVDLTLTLVDGYGNSLPLNYTYCQGDDVNVKLTYNGGIYWGEPEWNSTLTAGDMNTSGLRYDAVNKKGEGTYTISNLQASGTLQVALTMCGDTKATSNVLNVNITPQAETPTVEVLLNIEKCGNDITQYGKIQISPYNAGYTYKINDTDVTPNNNGIVENLSTAGSFTLSAINSCKVSTPSAPFTISETDNKPTISISGSEKAVLYEDVMLTAIATQGATVKWYEGGVNKGEGLTYVVTSETATSKTITAKAFLNGCESTEASHPVTFSAEDCTPEVSYDIQIKFYHPSAKSTDDAKKGQWWGMGTLYYSTNNSTWSSIDMGSKTSGTHTETISNISKSTLYVYFQSYWTYSHDSKAKSNTLTLERGKKYDIKITRHGDNNINATATATETGSLTNDPPIKAPAVKMVSAEYDEVNDKIVAKGAVYRTGCGETFWGFQYSADGQTWGTTNEYFIRPSTGNSLSVPGEFEYSFPIPGANGGETYYIRAYALNNYNKDNYNLSSAVYSTTSLPVEIPSKTIESATISLVDSEGNPSTNSEVCPQSTVYLKVSYVGGDFKSFEAADNFPGTDLELVNHDKVNNYAIFSYTATSTGVANITISNENTSVTPETGVNIAVKEVAVATPPTIYLEKNTICETQTTNVVVNSPIVGLSYSLKNGSVGDPVTYESGDLKFSVSKEGSYTVQVQETVCGTTAISAPVDLRVITSDVKITLTTDVNEISPWQPLTLTVKAPSGYDYDLQGLDGTVYTKSGDVYTIKFPRPDSWGVGNSASESEPKTFTAGIKAGEEPSCSTTTKEIQLVDTEEVCLAPGN